MTFATSPEALERHSQQVLDLVRDHLAGKHVDPEHYQTECLACDHGRLDVEVEQLTERLKAAETVCTIFGWTGYGEEGRREKAAVQAYMDWANAYGAPRPDPEWNERVRTLAARRDEERGRALTTVTSTHEPVQLTDADKDRFRERIERA